MYSQPRRFAMNKVRLTINALATLLLTLILASLARAQATRTWVSGVGDDVNPCSRTAPCKTFAGAISKTADKGEIDALDPGGFGTGTIRSPSPSAARAPPPRLRPAGPNGVTVTESATATPNTIV